MAYPAHTLSRPSSSSSALTDIWSRLTEGDSSRAELKASKAPRQDAKLEAIDEFITMHLRRIVTNVSDEIWTFECPKT
jgi:hypothetical protein